MTIEKMHTLNDLVEGDPTYLLDLVEGRVSTEFTFTPLDWGFLAQCASTRSCVERG